jgi:2-polyprenyl-6-hydroxyphenyl methylase/3-demethylubiquinone-9 3-methyltransferase
MIAVARTRGAHARLQHRVRLAVEPAEHLVSVEDSCADAVLCVGAFEHMQDQRAVLQEVRRILRPGGVFVCLSVNGGCLWYTHLAPSLALPTRHLSSDRYLSRADWHELLREAGLEAQAIGHWRFVPAGDMPPWAAVLMQVLDRLGAAGRIGSWRGGCYVKATKRC